MRLLVTPSDKVKKAQDPHHRYVLRGKGHLDNTAVENEIIGGLTRKEIQAMVGDFNYIKIFIDYLEKGIARMTRTDAEAFIKKRVTFWKHLIGYHSGIGSGFGLMKAKQFYTFRKGYIFTPTEFKYLLRYIHEQRRDVEESFGLIELIENGALNTPSIYLALNSQQKMLIEMLVDRFRTYLKSQYIERGFELFEYPISRFKFNVWEFIFKPWPFKLGIYPRLIIRALRTSFKPFELTESERARLSMAKWFWWTTFIEWWVWNFFAVATAVFFGAGSLPWPGVILTIILLVLNAKVSFRAIGYFNLKSVEEDTGRVMGYHKVTSMADVQKRLPEI